MNDFDYDVMQKKRIARGASRMKRGSKSKKCTLPSDYLTAAQKRRLNGPVSTYKLDEPMSLESFKAMPEDLQKQYMELRSEYIAMFGPLNKHDVNTSRPCSCNDSRYRKVTWSWGECPMPWEGGC